VPLPAPPHLGGGAICKIVNHQGHQGTRRKYLKPKAFVPLVVQDFIGSIVKLHHYPNLTQLCLPRTNLLSLRSPIVAAHSDERFAVSWRL
jgi:hypothetical protein